MTSRRLCTLAMALFGLVPAPALLAATMPPGVAWIAAASDADIDRAFAQARAERKPLLLYWGADWCPPCNHLKSTLFNRQDFALRARSFVPVFVDGDGPGAQRLGTRFKVRGYPTLVLLGPQGRELMRLPGEVDAPQVLQLLQTGLAGGRPVKAVLADARAGKPLAVGEWRMLAFYSWGTDEAQLVDAVQRPALLAELAAKCPPTEGDAATRLLLKALADGNDGKRTQADAAIRERVLRLLTDAPATRAQMDVVTHAAPSLAKALAADAGAERQRVVAAFESALKRLEADATLSRADRLSALLARVELARLDQPKSSATPKLQQALLDDALEQTARFDREISDGDERQAVITGAAYTLGRAGLWSQSDALLKDNLANSHSPYYLMSQLAGNARKQGRNDEALRWHEQAFAKSQGPATRLQWGASYVGALIDLAPQDAPRIEAAAAALFAEAAQPNAFYERNERALHRVGERLSAWNKGGQHAAVIRRLQTQLDGVCRRLDAADPQRATCESLHRSLGAAA